MKSSRSQSTKSSRRNARRLISESSDNSDGIISSNEEMDSARAEKIFSRRRCPNSISNINNSRNTSINIPAERTLFRLSDTSDSESSQSVMDKIKPGNTKEPIKLSKNDLLKYRDSQSSNDDQSKSSNFDVLNEVSVSKSSSIISENDISGECGILEEFIDKSIRSSSENISINNESSIIIPKKFKNKQRVIIDSSDDSDSGQSINRYSKNYSNTKMDSSQAEKLFYGHELQESVSNLNTRPKKSIHIQDERRESDILKSGSSQKNSIKSKNKIGNTKKLLKYHDQTDEIIDDISYNTAENNQSDSLGNITLNESSFITTNKVTTMKIDQNTTNFDSESDDDIINSIEIPIKVNPEQSQIENALKDLSLIEPSDSDSNTSAHYKSTIASSNQSRPFFDDLKLSHSLYNPSSQSSVLENSIFEVSIDDIPNVPNHEASKVSSPKHNQSIIDLTEDDYKKSSIVSKHDSFNQPKNPTADGVFEYLKMEKIKLEEIKGRFIKNINNMKITMKVTNLHLLPDGGLKLKRAILKEESLLKDTEMQLKNLLEKLKKIPGKSEISPLPSNYQLPFKSSNVNDALTKKAAANIDIHTMGNQALSTYRTQQTMTLDVLNRLHKSLETCPTPNILADDPPGLKVELMPHQKHAIAWLMWRESQKPHGGVLADDMGLGKTLTMLSLILKDTAIKEDSEDSDSEDDSSKNNYSINGGTLIICPSSLISQWENEVKSKLSPRILDVVQHYGSNRESSARRLARKDLVITTYHVVMWDQKKSHNASPLFQIKWKRIILDEAHTIRNYKSQTSIAVSALSGVNRWALSGTPIHNKEADFYALLKFIKCRPFDDWAIWKRWVGNNDTAGKNRLSLLVKTLMLRRTKAELSEGTSFKLPTKTFHTIDVELFKEEKEAYEKVLLFSSSLFATYLYEKAEKENAVNYGFPRQNKVKYLHKNNLNDNIFKDHPELDKLFKQLQNNKNIQAHHILVLLLRLRQLCCHPCLMKNMLDSESLKVDGIKETGDLDLVDHMSRMSIGIPSVEHEKETLINSNPIFKDSWVSSKIKAVCNMVKEKVLHTDEKAVVVSQWPSMLHLIDKQLCKYQVKTELFTGAVPIPHRNKIVGEFNNLKGGAKILLLSLTAGGVGLNLVAANHLFLVDIHWNPQLEAQACDRIYRVGQTKPVNVYKFICANTIESSIQSIQTHKIEIANNLFGGSKKVEGTKITLEDLKLIFNINPSNKLG